jgi:hypothetical protein
MKKLVEEFLKDNCYQANEHGVYVYKSQDGSDTIDIQTVLELFGRGIIQKMQDTVKD